MAGFIVVTLLFVVILFGIWKTAGSSKPDETATKKGVGTFIRQGGNAPDEVDTEDKSYETETSSEILVVEELS